MRSVDEARPNGGRNSSGRDDECNVCMVQWQYAVGVQEEGRVVVVVP